MADDERRMTIVEHLEELRKRLIVCVIAWLAATLLSFAFNGWLLGVLLQPLKTILRNTNHVVATAIFTNPTEGLTVPMKLAAISGFVIALPILLWQTWGFVAPALRPRERKFAGPFIATALILFAAGAAFAYLVMPLGLNFLATFLAGNAVFFPDINQYLSFLTLLILVFGVTFELPIVVILLGLVGLTTSQWLASHRRAIWIGIIFAALIVTPGADPFTPTALAIPLIVLFELALLVLRRVLHR